MDCKPENIDSFDSFDSNFWQDRRVLVTGGTGLVGGWLIKRLLAARGCRLLDP